MTNIMWTEKIGSTDVTFVEDPDFPGLTVEFMRDGKWHRFGAKCRNNYSREKARPMIDAWLKEQRVV